MTTAEHVPSTIKVTKMSAYVPMFRGSCSCGWRSQGFRSTESQALKDAQQHADARNRT